MTERKFYKRTYVVEVLSEEPLSGHETLNDLFHMTTSGGCSGLMRESTLQELNGKQVADELLNHGSAPEFFRVNENGDDEEPSLHL